MNQSLYDLVKKSKKRTKKPMLLKEVGRALYGNQWQSALARDLNVSDRTIRRWTALGRPPPHQWDKILIVVGEKNRDLVRLIREIEVAE